MYMYIYSHTDNIYVVGSSARFPRAPAHAMISQNYITELNYEVVVRKILQNCNKELHSGIRSWNYITEFCCRIILQNYITESYDGIVLQTILRNYTTKIYDERYLTANILRQMYNGRYITAIILRHTYYGIYITADILRQICYSNHMTQIYYGRYSMADI